MAIPWVTTVARLILGAVLIVAGGLKIGGIQQSVMAVRAYRLLPDPLATTVGYGLPIVEIVIGVLLVVGLLTRVAAVVGGLLMLAFVFGIGWAWARGLRIDCGCFGGGGQLESWEEPSYLLDIVRDFGLVLLAAWTVRFPPGRFALDAALGLAGGSRDREIEGDEDE
ncbi:MauE/DoxX family redox-associated membrane protein [Nonomuraea africana]|uniref:Membrane protein YphA (DoxX/SURF4 family) n=1 Tax=Nonomuraea africana TaxID=46171 RepID=A0ABR9KHS5_9ACTN|nr:MauE/DoxX family redox-associated membrane protein [Nonomuraea africana]MBE1561356.1 putative membrane protein YphA (DoxX/SURF4 family) [Nonomuraea africana]